MWNYQRVPKTMERSSILNGNYKNTQPGKLTVYYGKITVFNGNTNTMTINDNFQLLVYQRDVCGSNGGLLNSPCFFHGFCWHQFPFVLGVGTPNFPTELGMRHIFMGTGLQRYPFGWISHSDLCQIRLWEMTLNILWDASHTCINVPTINWCFASFCLHPFHQSDGLDELVDLGTS